MKRFSAAKFALPSICALGLATAVSVRADTIAAWSFESGQNSALVTGTTTSATFGPISADSTYGAATGLLTGSATGVHASTSTQWSAPAGDANAVYATSSHSMSVNNFTQGDYDQFTVNLNLGSYTYSNIQLSWDQTGSNTGPATFGLYWSATGTAGSWTLAGADYVLPFATWNATTTQNSHESANLSADVALNTASTMYFRIVDDSIASNGSIVSGSVSTAGTDRIDNFVVTATESVVPEPATLSLVGGFGLLGWALIRRRK